MSRICDIATSLKANLGPVYAIYTSVMWKLETSRAHTRENGLFSEVGDVLFSSSTFEMENICIFIDSKFFNKGKGEAVIPRILKGNLTLFVGEKKSHQMLVIIQSTVFSCLRGIFNILYNTLQHFYHTYHISLYNIIKYIFIISSFQRFIIAICC